MSLGRGDGGEFSPRSPANHRFATTHWSMVVAAGGETSAESQRALEELCEIYWYPLYAFVRGKGYEASEAQDLTQEFFTSLLSNATLKKADQSRGRFRSFLLTSLQNFVSNQHRAKQALKRGGGHRHLSLDFQDGESRYRTEVRDTETPEKIFERRWALTLLQRAVDRLASEQQAAGKTEVWEVLKHYLGGQDDQRPYKEIGEQLGLPPTSIKVTVHRLRRRCRELLREEISQTVSTPEAIEDELKHLFQSVS